MPIDTRRAARRASLANAARIRDAALDVFRRRPSTADEVAETLGESVLSVRPRVTDLKTDGLIYDTGERRPSSTGHPAMVLACRIKLTQQTLFD